MLTIWLTAGQLKLVVHNNHIGLLLIWSKAWNVTTAVSSMVIVHQGSRVADSWKQCLYNNKSNNVEIDEHLMIGCQQNLFNGFLAQLCGLFCFIKQLLGSKIKLSWTAGQLDSWTAGNYSPTSQPQMFRVAASPSDSGKKLLEPPGSGPQRQHRN